MSDSEQTQQGESYPQPNPSEERTVESRVVTSHYDPAPPGDPQRTQPNLPKAPSAPSPQTAITPVVRNTPPQGYAPPQVNPAPRPPRQGRRRHSRGCMPGPSCFFGCMGFVGVLAVASLILILIGYTMLSKRLEANIEELEASLIAIDDPTSSSGFESTFIYDRNGAQLWEIFGQGRRQRIPLSDIPESVRQATVSVEDNDFYTQDRKSVV